MKSLQALADVFINDPDTDQDNFDFWAEHGEIAWSGEKISVADDSIRLFRKKYLAVYSFESYTQSADELFLKLMVWLKENGGNRDALDDPDFDVEMNDDDSADIEISLWFDDDVFGKLINGKYVLLDSPEITEAVEIDSVVAGLGDCKNG